jgi:hypothetical protein
VTTQLSIHRAPAWVALLGEDMRKKAHNGLVLAAQRAVGIVQNEIIPQMKQPPIDTDAYRGAWRATKTTEGAHIGNSMPYADIIEQGARAENIKIGRKMIEALTAWVLRKGFVPKARGTRAKVAAQSEAVGIAWAIAKSMQKKGIFNRDGQRGLHVLDKIAIQLPKIIAEEIKEALRSANGR